mgnify:CR=1 FL=1
MQKMARRKVVSARGEDGRNGIAARPGLQSNRRAKTGGILRPRLLIQLHLAALLM